MDLLKPGMEITLADARSASAPTRSRQEPFAVSPKQVEVVANTPDEATLTLTTCHPKGSARQRLIVKATMVRSNLETQPA